jgi:hypothetical protein
MITSIIVAAVIYGGLLRNVKELDTRAGQYDTLFVDHGRRLSVWGGPARVWPAGVGPNAATLQACFDTINKYYNVTKQPEFIQLVTLDDDDEGTNMETPKGGVNKWFAPVAPPVVIDHGEVWINGVKLVDPNPVGTPRAQ